LVEPDSAGLRRAPAGIENCPEKDFILKKRVTVFSKS
jgi:hypothetical protein